MTDAERDDFLHDLTEARLTARQLELMVDGLKGQLHGAARQDVLALGIRLCDLRLQLVNIAERAQTFLDQKQRPAAGGASTTEHLH